MSNVMEYIFVSLPEMFFTIILTFAIFGIRIRSQLGRIALFAITSSAFTVMGNIVFGANSIKVVITTPILVVLSYFIFKFKWVYALLTIFGVIVSVGIIQICILLVWSNLAGIGVGEIVMTLPNKILGVVYTALIQVPLAYLLTRNKWQFNLKGIER